MTENLKREEALSRSAALSVVEYDIHIDVSEAPKTELTTFPTRSRIVVDVHNEITTFADFIGQDVTASLDGQNFDPQYDGARIYLPTLAPGQHVLEFAGRGVYSRTGEGLHRFTDPKDKQTYLYTQFEPADSRRVFANFEQPNLKTRFTISITGPADWTLLSNGKEVSREEAPDNSLGTACATVHFAQTEIMPTYLTAFIAGPYVGFHDVAHVKQGDIELGFYCRATLADFFELDDIATVTKQGLATFPQAYGADYPWGKYDSVFVPEYNLGAMENPGCVTFSEDHYIYRGEATRVQRAGRANTILHEMSHMWFGDYATPAWWDDLWLKESFAEFMGAWASVEATKYTEAWSNFAGARLNWALETDQAPTTHPIVADIVDLEAADQAFDGITYAKGAAVLRQLVAYVGEEQFFEGVRHYFAEHAFANAGLNDLLVALEKASGRNLASWSKQWLETTSVSTLVATRGEDSVTITQEGTDVVSGETIRRPHRIKVSGFKVDGGFLRNAGSIEVDLTDCVEISLHEIGGDVDFILPNDSSLTYAKIALDERSLAAVLEYDVDDALSRSVISTVLWQMTRDGLLSAQKYAQFVLRDAHLEDSSILQTRTTNVLRSLGAYTPADKRDEALSEYFNAAYAALGQTKANSDQQTIWTRAVARSGARTTQSAKTIINLLATVTDQDLRWELLQAAAVNDAITQDELDDELARTGTARDVVAHMEASASFSGGRAATLYRILNDSLSNDEISALISGFMQPLHNGEARAALSDYFGILEGVWESKSQELAERIIYGLYPLSDLELGTEPEENADYIAASAWLDSHESAPGALRKIIRDKRDEHLRQLRNQQANRSGN